MNRENWLNTATTALKPLFHASGFIVPGNIRITCGWPSVGALAAKSMRIGECWSDTASKDMHFEIFISPLIADPLAVLAILAHELVHATVGLGAKHGAPFKRCAQSIGLVGKMTATTAGEQLTTRLNALVGDLGPYLHAQILAGATNGRKKQTTRMVKVECQACGYTARTTAKWLEQSGAPLCPSVACESYQFPMESTQ